MPGCPAVGATEKCGVFFARIYRLGLCQGLFKMPDAFEFPRMLGSIVPLVRPGHTVVEEIFSDGFPSLAAVIRSLHLLPEPTAALRCIDSVWIHRRSFRMINFPACKMWTADLPFGALSIRGQDESAFACADE